jgi:hypothetical protein
MSVIEALHTVIMIQTPWSQTGCVICRMSYIFNDHTRVY